MSNADLSNAYYFKTPYVDINHNKSIGVSEMRVDFKTPYVDINRVRKTWEMNKKQISKHHMLILIIDWTDEDIEEFIFQNTIC